MYENSIEVEVNEEESKDQPISTTLFDVEEEDIEYLWDPYVALEEVTIMSGDPGDGKSYISLALASALSNGHFPNGEKLEVGDTIIVTTEDDKGKTIRPRARKMGADLEKIHVIDRLFSLDETSGLALLENEIDVIKPKLVVIDPFHAYTGRNADLNRSNHTRHILQPVGKLAKKYNCAVLAIEHHAKAERDKAIHKVMGSVDIIAMARSGLVVARHPKDNKLVVMAHAKANDRVKGKSLQFRIEDDGLKWMGECDLTADKLLEPKDRRTPSKLDEAGDFLIDVLSENGQEYYNEIERLAKEQGLSMITVRRAKKELGVTFHKEKGTGKSIWKLPKDEEEDNDG